MELTGIIIALITLAVAIFLQTSPTTVAKNFRDWVGMLRRRIKTKDVQPRPSVPTARVSKPIGEVSRFYQGELTLAAIRAHIKIHGETILYGYDYVDEPSQDGQIGSLRLNQNQLLQFRRVSTDWSPSGFDNYAWRISLDEKDQFICTERYRVSGR